MSIIQVQNTCFEYVFKRLLLQHFITLVGINCDPCTSDDGTQMHKPMFPVVSPDYEHMNNKDAQNRLLWRDTTWLACIWLVMSWKRHHHYYYYYYYYYFMICVCSLQE